MGKMTMKPDFGSELDRRGFLKGGSFATMMMLMGGIPINAAEEEKKPEAGAVNADGSTNYKAEAAPVNVGVIGCGPWAREILKTLATLPNGPVVAICDTYPAMVKRAADLAPNAQKYPNHKDLLADPKVQAVVVATPTHLHKEIVIDALKAGKHVYCEAPLAASVEDARAIAQAVRENFTVNFQSGLQARSDKQIYNLANFIRSGVLGKPLKARQQFHKKQSWRFTSPNAEREKALNWRLDKEVSIGLAGELGVHQLDIANWYFNARPLSAHGLGSLIQWKDDGREVPDTISVIMDFPNDLTVSWQSTFSNSRFGLGIRILGSDGTIEWLAGTTDMVTGKSASGWSYAPEKLNRPNSESIKGDAKGDNHYANFVECVRSRQEPNSSVELGYKSALAAHLANLSYRRKQRVTLDSARQSARQ